MKTKTLFLLFMLMAILASELHGQFVNPNNRFGRGRTAIPQGPTAADQEPEKLTAEELVEKEMPKLIETLSLDAFEEAVVRSVLVKSVQKRMELQILKLAPEKMKEAYEKVIKEQDAELEAGLPSEKYKIYLEMRENPTKTKRKQKKKKKKTKS